jgi:hypothetical protein
MLDSGLSLLQYSFTGVSWLTYCFDPGILNERDMVRSEQPRFPYNLKQAKGQDECCMPRCPVHNLTWWSFYTKWGLLNRNTDSDSSSIDKLQSSDNFLVVL